MMQTASGRLALLALTSLIGAGMSAAALALDLPKRKSGLWEIKTSMPDMPANLQQGPMKVCVDEKTDDMTQQVADAEAKKNCSKSEIKRDGERWLVHSVCKEQGITMTTDGVFSGKFDSAYKAEMKATYQPQIQGMSSSRMAMDARYLGACPAGMKPGEVILPSGQKIDPSKLGAPK
jgi:hypothetical protein